MYGIWRTILLALLANALLAAVALARPVYLADGGVVQAQKVWQEDGRIYVLLNRDSLISFSPEEIDLRKTFPKKQAPVLRKPATRRAPVTAASAPQPAPAKSAAATPPPPVAPAQTATSMAQPKAATAPAAKTAPVVTKPQPATPAVATPPATTPSQPAVATTAKGSAAPSTPPAATSAAPATPAKPVAPPKPPAPPKTVAKKTPPPTPAVAPQLVGGGSVAALAMLGGILAFFLMLLAALWKVFVKAGQAGWKSLVPIYNFIVMLEIAGCPLWWFLMILIPVVNLWFLVVMHIRLAQKFGKGPLFGFGLCFLGFIFFPILAFGSATYEQHEDTFTFDENFDEEGL